MKVVNRLELIKYLSCLEKVTGSTNGACSFDEKGIYAIGKMGSMYGLTPNPTPAKGQMDASKMLSVLKSLDSPDVEICQTEPKDPLVQKVILSCKGHSSIYTVIPFVDNHMLLEKFELRFKANKLIYKACEFTSTIKSNIPFSGVHITDGMVYATDRQATLFLGFSDKYKEIKAATISAELIEVATKCKLEYFDVSHNFACFMSEDKTIKIGVPLMAGKYPNMAEFYNSKIENKELQFIPFIADALEICRRSSEFTESLVKVENGVLIAGIDSGEFRERILCETEHPPFYAHLNRLIKCIEHSQSIAIRSSELPLVFADIDEPRSRIILSQTTKK